MVKQKLSEEELVEIAKAIHERVLTLDSHIDINTSNFTNEKNYTQDLSIQVTLPKMEQGGLDVGWFVVYTSQGVLDDKGYQKALESAMDKFNAIHWMVNELAPERIALAVTSNEARKMAAEGKKVAMIGVENGYSLGTDISNVKKFYKLGARYISLSHNGHSQLCDSNTGEQDGVWLHNGVSALGKEVISEMNKLGIMADVSHLSKKSMMDIIELSKAPIIASHSSARALCGHSRNLDDEQLLLLKKNGGVVQAVAFSAYLHTEKHNNFSEARNEVYKEIAAKHGFTILERSAIVALDSDARKVYLQKYREIVKEAQDQIELLKKEVDPVNVSEFVDHIDYIVNLIGLEYVGISSDFDGGGGIDGWADASETFNVTIELVRRAYTEEQIGKLWSGNFFRVLDEVQRIAEKIQETEEA